MEFAIGRPAMQVSVDANSQELNPTKVIHLVRWLPPDPNDRSREIAPEPLRTTYRRRAVGCKFC
jgi:hypothetical protein